MKPSLAVIAITFLLSGCLETTTKITEQVNPSETTAGDAGGVDTGGTDTGTTDGGGLDSGGTDSGTTDTGGTDTGGTDIGTTDLGGTDTGGTDIGTTDMGTTDMGTTDIGGTDTGGTDIGTTDFGTTDTGGTTSGGTTSGGTDSGTTDSGIPDPVVFIVGRNNMVTFLLTNEVDSAGDYAQVWRCSATGSDELFSIGMLENGTGFYFFNDADRSEATWAGIGEDAVAFSLPEVDSPELLRFWRDVEFESEFAFTANLYIGDSFIAQNTCTLFNVDGTLAEEDTVQTDPNIVFFSNGATAANSTNFWSCNWDGEQANIRILETEIGSISFPADNITYDVRTFIVSDDSVVFDVTPSEVVTTTTTFRNISRGTNTFTAAETEIARKENGVITDTNTYGSITCDRVSNDGVRL